MVAGEKRNKKSLALITGILVFSLLIAGGCGKKGAGEGKGIKLRFVAVGDPTSDLFRTRMGKDFSKTHPGVIATYDGIVGNYNSKILTQVAGGAGPDVFTLNDWEVPDYASKNAIMDITPLFKADTKNEDVKSIYPKLINACTYNGKLYGLPRNAGSMGLFYNKELFDKAGVAYPDETWDWNKFLEAAKKLTKKDKNGRTVQYGVTFPVFWDMFIIQGGGKFWDKGRTRCLIDSPEAIDAIQFVKDLSSKYGVCPTPQEKEMQSDYLMFCNKKAAMFMGGNWYRMNFKEIKDLNWHVSSIPKGKAPSPWLLCGVWVVSSQTKHPELAYDLVKYLNSPEAVKFLMNAGDCIPIHRNKEETEYFLNITPPPNKEARVFLNALDNGYSLGDQARNSNIPYSEMMNVLGDELSKFMLDKQTAKESLVNIKEQWLRMAQK